MASFNSINGTKMHGNKAMLTDYLRGELGFEGLVVGDWNAHGQIPGCEVDNCPQALLAGLDIYMVPDDWKGLLTNLVAQVNDGTIPMARLDEAVARVLRVKLHAGLLSASSQRPSERGVAGQLDLLGSPEHRAIAREAVAKSQVILKNNGVLPLRAGAKVLVAGSAADNVGQASGGWTLEWQGMSETKPELFPHTISIWQGINEAVTGTGGIATLSIDGSFTERPDVAIVVFGEKPYAEFAGDRRDLLLRDEEGLELLQKFHRLHVPTVAVFISGRPMWMNRELNASDAFVASWLPGSEGNGVADVLTGAVPSTGRLSFSWPGECDGRPTNGTDNALFEFGYGRSLQDTTALPVLSEECTALTEFDGSEMFASGRLGQGVVGFANRIGSTGPNELLSNLRGKITGMGVSVRGYDRSAQEDAREVQLAPGARFGLTQMRDSGGAYRIAYEVVTRPSAPIMLRLFNEEGGEPGSAIDLTRHFAHGWQKGWREMLITESCAPGLGKSIAFDTEGDITFRISSVRREQVPEGTACTL